MVPIRQIMIPVMRDQTVMHMLWRMRRHLCGNLLLDDGLENMG